MRIHGVGKEWSELLLLAGVNNVPELAGIDPFVLHPMLIEAEKSSNIVDRLPSPEQVSTWVDQAKKLQKVIE